MSDESKLAAIEKKRAERKAASKALEDEQVAIDLEAITDLEDQYGDSNIAILEVPFTMGLPARVAGRTPSKIELKRYRDRVTPKRDDKPIPHYQAACEIADTCLVYPSAEVFAQLVEARPGLKAQLGLATLRLAAGRAEEQGKD